MEQEHLKRGIDLQKRLWDGTNSSTQKLFKWWRGGRINKLTLFLMLSLLILRTYLIYPLLFHDLSPAFATSVSIQSLANFFVYLGMSRQLFFSLLAFTSLNFVVVGYYLFVRRLVHRHELTAFISTLFFLLPNPFFGNQMPLVYGFFVGDGAHIVAFALVPLFLLYIRAFISNGLGGWAVTASLGSALIAIISPFAYFNLFVMSFVITVSEGFLGNMRIKLLRFAFLHAAVFGLSFFWYYPHFFKKLFYAGNIASAASKLWSVFPLLIPSVPVVGTVAFLIFDRREKLKPIFIATCFCGIYLTLYLVSKSINASGIFVADRYLVELYFALSFLIPLVAVLVFELSYVKAKEILAKQHSAIWFAFMTGVSFVVFLSMFFMSADILSVRAAMKQKTVIASQKTGIGNIERAISIRDIGGDVAILLSCVTLITLVQLARKFPPGSPVAQ